MVSGQKYILFITPPNFNGVKVIYFSYLLIYTLFLYGLIFIFK
jgi:hypothetical protein